MLLIYSTLLNRNQPDKNEHAEESIQVRRTQHADLLRATQIGQYGRHLRRIRLTAFTAACLRQQLAADWNQLDFCRAGLHTPSPASPSSLRGETGRSFPPSMPYLRVSLPCGPAWTRKVFAASAIYWQARCVRADVSLLSSMAVCATRRSWSRRMPVVARYKTPAQGIGRWRVNASQTEVRIRGALEEGFTVMPGDIIVGDADRGITIPE